LKVTKHIEQLLRQGRKPKELIDLGFAKATVTRVYRRVRREKAAVRTKEPEVAPQAKSHLPTLPESPQKMANDLQKVDNLMAAAQELGTYRCETCPYQKDSVCTLQTWTNQGEIPRGIGEPVAAGNEKPEWYIKPSPFYCAMCTAPLEDHINDVEDQTLDTPLWGARHGITCDCCGSKGWIAIRIKCTKCGRETYWGWWPEKE